MTKNPNRKQSFKVECFVFGEVIASCATTITSHMEKKERIQLDVAIPSITSIQFTYYVDDRSAVSFSHRLNPLKSVRRVDKLSCLHH